MPTLRAGDGGRGARLVKTVEGARGRGANGKQGKQRQREKKGGGDTNRHTAYEPIVVCISVRHRAATQLNTRGGKSGYAWESNASKSSVSGLKQCLSPVRRLANAEILSSASSSDESGISIVSTVYAARPGAVGTTLIRRRRANTVSILRGWRVSATTCSTTSSSSRAEAFIFYDMVIRYV